MLRGLFAAATAVALAVPSSRAAAQEEPPAERLRVYLDCRRCDFDFIRTEMSFVDYVRDRTDADVHILVTTQGAGAGGNEYTLDFIGLRAFDGVNDTLRYVSSRDDTPDVTRRGLTRMLKIGMMRYIATTPLAARIDIGIVEETEPLPTSAGRPADARDPWNFWVFTVGGDFSVDAESRQRSRDMSLELEANRTTENWKINLTFDGGYDESEFEIDSTSTVTSIRRNYNGELLLVKSLGPHVSVGVEGSLQSSTFGNQKLAWRMAPALEYNVFPYTETTRRSLTVLYGVGMNRYEWREVTIFGEVEETRPTHVMSVGYSTRQPWGNMSASVNFSQFLHDTQKNRITFNGNGNVRLFRGLSLNFGGSYSKIRDQISLARRDLTPDEIFLRLRQLRTDYRFDVHVGMSYRFGSIFNNVVNPRFRRGGFGDFD